MYYVEGEQYSRSTLSDIEYGEVELSFGRYDKDEEWREDLYYVSLDLDGDDHIIQYEVLTKELALEVYTTVLNAESRNYYKAIVSQSIIYGLGSDY